MTTVSEIITAAFREGNLLEVGSVPGTNEIAEALPRLNNIYSHFFGFQIGEKLKDWPIPAGQRTSPVSANYPLRQRARDLTESEWTYPPANTRLVTGLTATKTVYLQQMPEDGARVQYVDVGHTGILTIDANGRNIEGTTSLTITPAVSGVNSTRTWFYRADLGNWVLLDTLSVTDESPLPSEFDDLFISALAIRLAPRYGQDTREGTASIFSSMLDKAKTRYRQSPPIVYNAPEASRQTSDYFTNRSF